MAEGFVPPHDEDAEKALLASILIEPACFREINKIIQAPGAFFIFRHGWIYESMQRLAKEHKDIDLVSLSSDLTRRGLSAEIGDLYLQELIMYAAPTAQNATTYAEDVAAKWVDRRVINASSEIARLGNSNMMSTEEKRIKAKTILASAFEGTERNKKATWDESVDGTLTKLYDDVWGEQASDMLTTGISKLDEVLDESLMLGKMIIVAAKPKCGKSTLMRSIALTNAKFDRPVAIFSHEEREDNIARTMLAREAMSTVSTMALRRMVHKENRADEAAAIYNRLLQKGNELKRLPINAIYASGWTVEDEVMEIERLRDVYGTKMFVVDYAQRIRESGKRDRRLELAHIGKSLANAAHELGVTILLGSQVNDLGRTREAEDLENEMDAKVLIMVDDSDMILAQSGKAVPVTLRVDGNRNGPSGDVPALYKGAHRLFTSAEIVPTNPK